MKRVLSLVLVLVMVLAMVPSVFADSTEKEEYVISSNVLALGDNTLTLDSTAVNTLWEFEPTEAGTYTFTAPAGALVGDWNASYMPLDKTTEKTNTLSWVCSSVGQSILVGVANVEGAFTLNVAKTAEAEVEPEKVYVDYVNVHTPSAANVPAADFEYVSMDITGWPYVYPMDDGLYYTWIANQDVPVYVDLQNEYFKLSEAATGAFTMRGMPSENEDGTVVTTTDYLSAMKAYSAYDLYPLTEDLVAWLKDYGQAAGWYNSNLSPFPAVQAGTANEYSAWLVMCVYDAQFAPGTEFNPIEVADDYKDNTMDEDGWPVQDATVTDTISPAAGETVHYTGLPGGTTLTVANAAGLTVTVNGQSYSVESGTLTVDIPTSMMPMIPVNMTVVSTNGGSYDLVFTYPVGNYMNPAELVIGANAADIAANSWGYYYNWTADGTGDLTITMDADCTDWTYVINNYGTSTYGDTHYSDDDPVVASETIPVSAGDEIEIVIGTASYGAGKVTFQAEMEYASGTVQNPIWVSENVTDNDDSVVTMTNAQTLADATHYVARVQDAIITVSGEGDFAVIYNGETYNAVDGVATVTGVSAANFFTPATFAVTGTGDYTIEISYPEGTQSNPAELVIGDNTATIAAGEQQGYYYTWTATGDGTLVLVMPSDIGWFVNVTNTATMKNVMADSAEAAGKIVELEVSKDDEISVIVNTFDPENPYEAPAGTVEFIAGFDCAHGNMEHHDAVKATCLNDGNYEYWYCADCDCYFIEVDGNLMNTPKGGWVIPGGENYHNYTVHEEAKAATCMGDGNYEYMYCEVCDTFFYVNEEGNLMNTAKGGWVIPGGAEYHDMEHVEALDATCHLPGYVEFWYCYVCECFFVADDQDNLINSNVMDVIVPAEFELQHFERVEPTTEKEGNVEYWYCEGCDCYFVMDDEGNLINTNAKNIIIPKVSTPVTGDNTSIVVLAAAMVISIMGIAAVVFTKKRNVA